MSTRSVSLLSENCSCPRPCKNLPFYLPCITHVSKPTASKVKCVCGAGNEARICVRLGNNCMSNRHAKVIVRVKVSEILPIESVLISKVNESPCDSIITWTLVHFGSVLIIY